MRQKRTTRSKVTIVIFLFSTITFITVVCASLHVNQPHTVITENVHNPSFSFNAAAAPGWRSPGNNWPDKNDYTGGQMDSAALPMADIVVYSGTEKSFGSCFAAISYYSGTIDITSSLEKAKAGMSMGQKVASVVRSYGETTQLMMTPEGLKTYINYQFDLNLPNVQRGNEFGYVILNDGYIEVKGVCSTVGELAKLVPALNAVSLNL